MNVNGDLKGIAKNNNDLRREINSAIGYKIVDMQNDNYFSVGVVVFLPIMRRWPPIVCIGNEKYS